MWGILARVMTAIEWIKRQRWTPARECLVRATTLARAQTEVFEIMKTMTPDSFLAFRTNTGESSAVQSTSNHLLHIFMQGVDPAKAEAIADVPENEYLLRYANPHFMPLRHAVETIPTDDPDGQAVVEEARRIDRELFRWRASHYGVARRYLPEAGMGTGGTAGAAYLKTFYANRIFTTTGGPARPPEVVSPLDGTPPIERGRARPILSWQN
jgi:tryptophan 2,3-dioxygenase